MPVVGFIGALFIIKVAVPSFLRGTQFVYDFRLAFLPFDWLVGLFFDDGNFLLLLQGLHADIGTGDVGFGIIGNFHKIIKFFARKHICFLLHIVKVYIDVDIV